MDKNGDHMKIAIDLDNTVTADVNSIKFFRIMSHLLIGEHEIYIITNREPGTEKQIAEELHEHGIEYRQIVITAEKSKFIKENGITIYFEDTDEYFLEIGKEVLVFKIRETGNFDFSAKKWVGSLKTTKII